MNTVIHIFAINFPYTIQYGRWAKVFSRNFGHSNTLPYALPYFQSTLSYICDNLTIVQPYTDRIVRPGSLIICLVFSDFEKE